MCCNSWGRKELDTTEQLNWTETLFQNRVAFRGSGFIFGGVTLKPVIYNIYIF